METFRIRQEKRHVEEELYRWGVLRYGWREEDLEGVPGVKVSGVALCWICFGTAVWGHLRRMYACLLIF